MVKHVVGKAWAGWEVFIGPRNDADPYQFFCRKLVPCTRSDDPKQRAPGPENSGTSAVPRRRGIGAPLTYARSAWDLSAVIPTIKINIVKQVMEEMLAEFFAQSKKKSGPETTSASEIFDSSFVLGELCHQDISPKRFLIENMSALKENGFNTLYFEHLYYDNQKDLEAFNKTGVMSEALKDQLETLDDGNLKDNVESGFTFTQILIAAQKNGIRVVATDTGATYSTQHNHKYGSGFDASPERLKYFSYTASKIIEEDIRLHEPQGKWIAMMGSAHVSTMKEIPGVGELMGVRRVVIGDANAPEILLNEKEKRFGVESDVCLNLDPKQSTVLSMVISSASSLATKPTWENTVESALEDVVEDEIDVMPKSTK